MTGAVNNKNSESEIARYKRKKFFIYTALLLAFLLLVLTIIFFVTQESIVQRRENKQYDEIASMKEKITNELSSVGADLLYFSQSDLAAATLSSQDVTAKAYLSSLIQKISSLKSRYSQIRLLDIHGNEVIRFDQNSDLSPHQVSSPQLQDKSHRYYFRDALHLKPDEIYTSKFDLNIEHGEVELPIKPMIRFSTPVYSEQDGLVGVGVINYDGNHIFQTLDKLNEHDGDEVFLINKDGYYLKANNPHKEWSFMFPEKKQFQFSGEHPKLWRSMQDLPRGKLTGPDGEYYFYRFQLSPSQTFSTVNSEVVLLIMHVPKSIIKDELSVLMQGLTMGFLLVTPAIIYLSFKLASSQSEQERLLNKLRYEARHDALTGLYNRKAIMESLKTHVSLCRRRKSNLAVGFIDINDLKITNDLFGHEAGDELIEGVATAINMSIRESDCAARIGGDEFLVVFIDCDESDANISMLRIQSAYCSLGDQQDKDWNLSFGCSELEDESDNIEALIARADSAMYRHKMRMKKSGNEGSPAPDSLHTKI